MKGITNRVGEVHNSLTIIAFDKKENNKNYWWVCKCECGTIKSIRYHSLQQNSIKSCGCKRMEVISTTNITHGFSKTDEYNIWRGIIKRCTKATNKDYKNYGARGITISKRWLDSFENFIKDMGFRPTKNHSIERLNNNGNYCKENCKWATDLEQANNRNNNLKVINLDTNEIYTSISDAARKNNVKMRKLHKQLTGIINNTTNLQINDKRN